MPTNPQDERPLAPTPADKPYEPPSRPDPEPAEGRDRAPETPERDERSPWLGGG